MLKSKIKKETVIKDFREELKFKDNIDKQAIDMAFFKILNNVYKYDLEIIKSNITRLGSLSFLLKRDNKFAYLEWSPKMIPTSLLTITIIDGNINDDGVYNLSLEGSLEKLDNLWKMNN